MLDQWQKVTFFTPKRQGCTETEQPSLLSVYLDSGYTFSDFLGRRTRAAEVLTYADVWATMETAGRAAGTGTGSKLKIEFSGQGAGEDGQHRQAR